MKLRPSVQQPKEHKTMTERKLNIRTRMSGAVFLCTCLLSGTAAAEDRWYAGATAGFTNSSVSSLQLDIEGIEGRASAEADNGYTMGAVIGREFDGRWRLEGEFRYRTNEFKSVGLANGDRIDDGDFSSGALGLNTYWLFGDTSAAWRPFAGVGLAWMQEIDLDLAEARSAARIRAMARHGNSWAESSGN